MILTFKQNTSSNYSKEIVLITQPPQESTHLQLLLTWIVIRGKVIYHVKNSWGPVYFVEFKGKLRSENRLKISLEMGWRMELLGQFGWNPADHWVKQDLLLNLDVQALNIKGTAAYKCQILRGQEPIGQNVFSYAQYFEHSWTSIHLYHSPCFVTTGSRCDHANGRPKLMNSVHVW